MIVYLIRNYLILNVTASSAVFLGQKQHLLSFFRFPLKEPYICLLEFSETLPALHFSEGIAIASLSALHLIYQSQTSQIFIADNS